MYKWGGVGLPLRVQKPSGKVEKEEKASRSRENGVSWAEGAVAVEENCVTLDTCFHCLEKFIAEALEPIVKFRRYKAFKHVAIREF